MHMERWRFQFGGRGHDLDLRLRVDGEAENLEALSARGLLAIVRPPFGIVLGGRYVFTGPLCPIPRTLGPRIGDCGKEVV